MNRAIQFVGVVWLGVAVALCAAQKPPKNPPAAEASAGSQTCRTACGRITPGACLRAELI